MLRRTLTILSLLGLLVSVGLWGVSYFNITYAHDESIWFLQGGSVEWDRGIMAERTSLQASITDLGAKIAAGLPPSDHSGAWMRLWRHNIKRDQTVLATLPKPRSFECRGFAGFTTIWRPRWQSARSAVLPLWIPVFVFAIPLERTAKELRAIQQYPAA